MARLQVGVDVPWVTSWSGEPVLGVRRCPTVGGALAVVQAQQSGAGRPQYAMNHLVRQRESVRRMLCPMCGKPTSEGDRWTQTGRRVAAGVLRASGLSDHVPAGLPDRRVLLSAGSIAPSHRACAERALEHCPHLRTDPDPRLLAFPLRWFVTPLLIEAIDKGAPAHVLAVTRQAPPSVPVVSFLQLCGVTDDVDAHWRRGLAPLRAG